MRILRIVEGTSVDGPGLRTSIYFAGCRHYCPGCHNKQSWDFAGGEEYSVDDVMETVRYNGFPVTFSGGDPMYQAKAILPLARRLKAEGYGIWCYTGFTLDELLRTGDESQRAILELIDVLVDGPFMLSQRNTGLRFRGSANQRLIDMRSPDFKDWTGE